MGAGRKLCLWFLANCEVQLCSALAAMSILGVVVVCPVILDPAIETLVSSYDSGMCQTIYSGSLRGISNCTWTSCREGCTADIYACTQILVLYVKGTPEGLFGSSTGNETLHIGWDLPTYNYSYTLARDLNLSSIHSDYYALNLTGFGIGALLPNPQGCIYPGDLGCSDFLRQYRNQSAGAWPCFISSSNSTQVVTTVDRMGAIRNIFYSLLPLLCAFGIFTYLFYQVGLIGRKRRLKDEEESLEGSPSKNGTSLKKNGALPNANAERPGIQKKLRKKFLPKRDNSSKKRRKGKIFNKKNLLNVKQQLSVRSPGSSVGGRAMSMTSEDFGGAYSNTQSSRQYAHRASIQPV